MILFRPLIRYADFNGRASRAEYWLFAALQGLWYVLLIGLAVGAMGQSDMNHASTGALIALGLIGLSAIALIVPNYAVLVRRLHDSGRGAIWLCLLLPSVLCSVIAIATVLTAVSAVGLGASRDAFVGTALAGLGAAGFLGLIGGGCQILLFALIMLPGTPGENDFGPDPRDPSSHYGDCSGGTGLDDARLEVLFAEAKRATGLADTQPQPSYGLGTGRVETLPPQRVAPNWNTPAGHNAIAPVFGRRRA